MTSKNTWKMSDYRVCLWNVNPEDRHCEYCTVQHCPERNNLGEQNKSYSSEEFIMAYYLGNLTLSNKNT